MKITLEHDNTVFEFEHQPLPESRFKTICGLAAAGMYCGMAVSIAALCGLQGVAVVCAATVFAVAFYMA